jgi:hypothetical protein
MKTITLDDEYSYTLHQSGSISTLPVEPEDDTIARLHEVIKEVTGVAVQKQERPRIGFLP